MAVNISSFAFWIRGHSRSLGKQDKPAMGLYAPPIPAGTALFTVDTEEGTSCRVSPNTGSPMWPPSEHAPDLVFPLAYHRSRERALQPTVLHRQRAPVEPGWLGLRLSGSDGRTRPASNIKHFDACSRRLSSVAQPRCFEQLSRCASQLPGYGPRRGLPVN